MNTLLAVLLASVTGLELLGVLAQASAGVRLEHPTRFYGHLVCLAIGNLCCLAACLTPYSWLQSRLAFWRFSWRVPPLLVGLAAGLLGAVLIPGIGEEANGAQRWFRLGGQPSEFAKLALVIALADYCARHLADMRRFWVGFLRPGLVIFVLAALVFAEPDWGTALLLVALSMLLLLVAGTRWAYVLVAGAAALVLVGLMLLHDPVRLKRVVVFPEQSAQRMKAAPHVTNSILALAAGRVFGTWIDGATQKYDHVGEQQTDFVLSLIGEELGFVGTSLVVLLFLSLIAAGAVISWRIQDPFGQLLTAGVTFMIALQAVINIAVITGSLPCKGLPLPFVSLGGSNLVSLLTGVGLLASAALRAPRQEAASPVKPEVKTQSAGVGTPRFTAPATEQ